MYTYAWSPSISSVIEGGGSGIAATGRYGGNVLQVCVPLQHPHTCKFVPTQVQTSSVPKGPGRVVLPPHTTVTHHTFTRLIYLILENRLFKNNLLNNNQFFKTWRVRTKKECAKLKK